MNWYLSFYLLKDELVVVITSDTAKIQAVAVVHSTTGTTYFDGIRLQNEKIGYTYEYN